MKARCASTDLREALRVVRRAAGKSAAMPILENVLLEADRGVLVVSATDLEVGVQALVEAATPEEGATTAPASLLSEFVARLPDEDLELSAADSTLTVRCGKTTAEFCTLPAEDFPRSFPKLEEADLVASAIPARVLAEAVERTAFACSKSELRPALTGILIQSAHTDGGAMLCFVATDGTRMAVYRSTVRTERPVDLIVPRRAMQELGRLADGAPDELVTMGVYEGAAVFWVGDYTVRAALIAATYPNYEEVIPHTFAQRVTVEVGPFVEALRRVAVTARDPNRTVVLRAGDGFLFLSSSTADTGSAQEEIRAETTSPETMEVAFNADFLVDGLRAVGTEWAVLDLVAPEKPAAVRPIRGGQPADDYVYVLAPVRVRR